MIITITLRNIWLSYLFISRRAIPDLKNLKSFPCQFIADVLGVQLCFRRFFPKFEALL